MSKTRKDLAALTCIPCRGGIPPLAEIKVKEMIRSVPGWTWKRNEADKIEKEYTFKDFKEAMVCIFVYANRQSSFGVFSCGT